METIGRRMKILSRFLNWLLIFALLSIALGTNNKKAAASTTQNLVLNPTADTYVRSSYPTTNFGTQDHINVNQTNPQTNFTGLILFDLSSIPRTANITKATLNFYVDSQTTQLSPHFTAMKTSWVETEATWQSASRGVPWPVLGGRDYDLWNFARVSTDLVDGPFPVWYSADVSLMVREWVTGLIPNYGFALQGAKTSGGFSFPSREYADPALRPHLNISYSDTGALTLPDSNVISQEALARSDSHVIADMTLSDAQYVLDDMVDLGQKYYYFGNFPAFPGSNQTAARQMIDLIAARGLKLIVNLQPRNTYSKIATIEEITQLGKDLATSFGDKVAVWDMSDENNNLWYEDPVNNPTADPAYVYPRTVAFFKGVKQGNPNAITGVTQPGATAPYTYLKAGLPYGLADWSDSWGTCTAYGSYDFPGPMTGINFFSEQRSRTQEVAGFGANATVPHPITLQQEGMVAKTYPEPQRSKMFLIKTIRDMYAGGAPSEWFKLENFPTASGGASDNDTWGMETVPLVPGSTYLRDWPNRVKLPLYYTFKNFNKYLNPGQYAMIDIGMTSSASTGFFKLSFKKDNNNLALVAWNANAAPTATADPGILTDLTLTDYGLIPTNIVDLITGNVTPLSPSDYSISNGKITIKNIEVVDYPRIINLSRTTSTLELKKSVDKISAIAGDSLTYTLTYSNLTPGTFTNARIEDPIPAGASYIDGSASNAGVFDGSKLIWTIGNLSPGTNGSVTFKVKIN